MAPITQKLIPMALFKRETYQIAKAFHHINIANEYLMDVQRETSGSIKNMFARYSNKLDFIINDMKFNLSERSREILKNELSQSFNIEAINDKMVHLEPYELDAVEQFIDQIINQKTETK
jgi:hypothetical protein